MTDPEGSAAVARPAVLASFTDEQLAAVKSRAAEMCAKPGSVNQLTTTMLAARRIYMLAAWHLNQVLEREEGCRWADGVEELLLQSMAAGATHPYQLQDLLQTLTGVVLPFLVDELEKERERGRSERLQIEKAAEAARLQRRIPLQILSETQETERGTVTVVCGPAASQQVLGGILSEVFLINEDKTAVPFYLVWLRSTAMNQLLRKSEQPERVLLEVGESGWVGKLPSRNQLEQLTSKWAQQLAKPRIDLLVLDDVLRMSYPEKAERQASRAAALLKALDGWARDTHAAVLAYLPLDDMGATERARFMRLVESRYMLYML